MGEKERCAQIWTLVTAGWPVQHTELLCSRHIVHCAVVQIASALVIAATFLTNEIPNGFSSFWDICFLVADSVIVATFSGRLKLR